MKAAIYCRVSTKEQKPENQLQALKDLAASRGMQVYKIYQEQETAWKDGHQKELARLLKDAAGHAFDIVLVWALDRLTRGGATATLVLVHRLKQDGVRVISQQEPWTEAPGEVGDLLYAMVGWVAAMESKRRSERVKAGLERKRLDGGRLGRKVGSKDRRKRKTAGYKIREARRRLGQLNKKE